MSAKQAVLLLAVVFVTAVGFSLSSRPGADASPVAAKKPAPPAQGDKIIAYYFHVTVRCHTCRTIERYSGEALKEAFPNELANGKIEWRPVNVQLPENRHFIKDYKLFTRSLVYVLVKDGKQVKYKVLGKTWELVGQEKWFKDYVKQEMRKYLRRLG